MSGNAQLTPTDLQRDPGTALAAVGAAGLLVSLFLPWWAGVSGWNAFEAWDLVLAALAVGALVAVAGRIGLVTRVPDQWLWACGAGAVVIVVENLINRPPIIQVATAVGAKAANSAGIWVALAASVAMLAGAELVRRGVGAPHQISPARSDGPGAGGSSLASTGRPAAPADDDVATAARRAAIAAALVRSGFVASDRAALDNPAVEVLAELLPPEAEIDLCLTCDDVSTSGQHTFTERSGQFPRPAGSPAGNTSRRAFVVCTEDTLCWTASHVLGPSYDGVTLYSVPFQEILGATVRQRRRGIVDVWIEDGPTLSFRVEPKAADALQSQVDRAAQSEESQRAG